MNEDIQINTFENPLKVTYFLSYIVLVLLILNAIACYLRYELGYESAYTFIPKFYMDNEGNVPAFFSTFILFCSSLLFNLIALQKKKIKDKYSKQWKGLAVIFFVLAIDEGFQIHELIGLSLKGFNFSGLFLFSWVIPALIGLMFFIIAYIKFFLALPLKYRYYFFLAAGVYALGTVGMEMVGGWYVDNNGKGTFIYPLLFTIEETLEMIGMVILIHTLLHYLKDYIQSVSILFTKQNNKIKQYSS